MLFAMMLIGFFLWRKQWIDESANQKLSKIVVNIFNPMMVVSGVLGKESGGDLHLVLQNLLFTVFFYALLAVFGVVVVLVLRPGRSQRDMYRMMNLFPNVGFMGIPVIGAVFGTESVIYIVFYMLGYNLLLYTVGIVMAGKAAAAREELSEGKTAAGGEKMARGGQWKRIFNAGVIVSLAAILIFVLQISLPEPVVDFCDYLGNATIPLSMILIGVSIAKADLRAIFSNVRMYLFIGMRMVLLPVAVILLMKNLAVDSVVFGVFALEMAMPVGSIVTLIAKEYGADETLSTNGIVLSTLASIVTIPVVCMFL